MVVDKEIKSLASYVTYRQLFDDGKRDVYFVISQFAENVIMEKKLLLIIVQVQMPPGVVVFQHGEMYCLTSKKYMKIIL